MEMNDLESDAKKVYGDIKSGKVAKEIKHGAKDAMNSMKGAGIEARYALDNVVDDMKDGIENIKDKF